MDGTAPTLLNDSAQHLDERQRTELRHFIQRDHDHREKPAVGPAPADTRPAHP